MGFDHGYIPPVCANPECVKHTDRRGGVFTLADGKWWCQECLRFRAVFNDGASLFSFTTTHFNGKPVEVKGLNHLRQLEKQYGVSNHAANYETKNWDTPPPVKQAPPMRQF